MILQYSRKHVFVIVLIVFFVYFFITHRRYLPQLIHFAPSNQLPGGNLVALEFSGQPRTFSRCVCSIERHVVEPLMRDGFEVHAFVLAETSKTTPHLKMFRYSQVASYHIRAATRPFPTKLCMQGLNSRFKQRQIQVYSRQKKTEKYGYARELLAQLILRQRVDQMRIRWEKSNNRLFDWIIVMRLDMVFVWDLPSLRALNHSAIHVPGFLSYGGINDRLAIGPPDLISQHYLTIYEGICGQGAKWAWTMPRNVALENLYQMHMDRRGVPIEKLPEWYRFARVRMHRLVGLLQDFVNYHDSYHNYSRIIVTQCWNLFQGIANETVTNPERGILTRVLRVRTHQCIYEPDIEYFKAHKNTSSPGTPVPFPWHPRACLPNTTFAEANTSIWKTPDGSIETFLL